jgi:multidrug resistance efflux pump
VTWRRAIAFGIALAIAAVPLGGCAKATSTDIAVAGDTRVDLVTVAAPKLATPTVDVTVGITKTKRSDVDTPGASAMMAAQMKAAAAGGSSRQAVPAGMLTAVMVRTGDRVKKGQVLATFDDRLLKLGVQNAEASERKANATPGVLKSQAADLRDTRATARQKIASGQAKLDSGRAQLEAGIAKIQAGVKQLPTVLAGLSDARTGLAAITKALAAALRALAAAKRAGAPASTIAQLEGQIKGLAAQRAQLAGIVQKLSAALAGIRAGQAMLPQLQATLQQLQTAQAQLNAGKSGISKLSDAISQLESGSDVAKVAAGVPSAGLARAEAALAQATLYAPSDGVVVSAMQPGELPIVGAPVVVVRPAGDTLVDTYLTSDQLEHVKVGSNADVSMDSIPGVLHGTVKWISADQQFAPSNYPTQIVHLSRVVRVTVSVPEVLPAGVPADVVIHPSS